MGDLDLGQASAGHFSALRERVFRVDAQPSPIELELVQVETLPTAQAREGTREPFALLFRGPRTPLLEQQIYALRHPTLGTIDLFLVPIGPDDRGPRYEAVFN